MFGSNDKKRIAAWKEHLHAQGTLVFLDEMSDQIKCMGLANSPLVQQLEGFNRRSKVKIIGNAIHAASLCLFKLFVLSQSKRTPKDTVMRMSAADCEGAEDDDSIPCSEQSECEEEMFS